MKKIGNWNSHCKNHSILSSIAIRLNLKKMGLAEISSNNVRKCVDGGLFYPRPT